MHYTHSEEKLSYWRTYTSIKVGAVIGDARVAIEVKSAEEVLLRHLKGLKTFGEEYPQSRLIIVSLDVLTAKWAISNVSMSKISSTCYGMKASNIQIFLTKLKEINKNRAAIYK